MADGVDQYLDYVQKQRSLRTYRTFRLALKNLFLNSYTKAYVDEVNRDDMLRHPSYCFDRDLTARSVPTDRESQRLS